MAVKRQECSPSRALALTDCYRPHRPHNAHNSGGGGFCLALLALLLALALGLAFLANTNPEVAAALDAALARARDEWQRLLKHEAVAPALEAVKPALEAVKPAVDAVAPAIEEVRRRASEVAARVLPPRRDEL